MPQPVSIAIGLLMLLGGIVAIIWFLWRTIKGAEDPAKMALKWALTLIIMGLFGYAAFKEVGFNAGGAFIVPFVCVLIGIVMSVVWAPHIGAWLAKPLTAMFDGGGQEPEPQPLYSPAIARRKAGKYREAVYEVQQQLERFPHDFTGQMLLAEIQAENLNDLQGARNAIEKICTQPGHPPNSIAYALNTLADWQLKHGQDPEAARQTLERIGSMLPDTEYANLAAQRIAHLGGAEMHLAPHERKSIQFQEGIQDIGLLADSSTLAPQGPDQAKLAADYVQHLQQHPLDNEAREKLAQLYAEYYGRPDLAALELEQMIQQPHQPPVKIVRWLNLAADLHVRHGQDEEGARASLQRIIELFPTLSHAQVAEQRLARLKLEIKGQQKSQAVKLGSYEQDIGLKAKR
jgi:outer membrane protein assembly factor BamD (BamD/ComL family)